MDHVLKFVQIGTLTVLVIVLSKVFFVLDALQFQLDMANKMAGAFFGGGS